MELFGRVCMHYFSCQPYHMPFKRKRDVVARHEWPDGTINCEIQSSRNNYLTFAYRSVGSQSSSLCSNLSSLTKGKGQYLFNRPKSKVYNNILDAILKSFQKRFPNTKLRNIGRQQEEYLNYTKLLETTTCVFVIFAILIHSVSAANLDLNIQRGRHNIVLEQELSRHIVPPLLYPKCSEDSNCPEDQVCKFRHSEAIGRAFIALNAPQVKLFTIKSRTICTFK